MWAMVSAAKDDTIHRLVISNYDQDHISNLPTLKSEYRILTLLRNKSISVDELRNKKTESGPLTDAMKVLLDMMSSYTAKASQEDIEAEGLKLSGVFHNSFSDFDDTNNCSVVSFLDMWGCRIAIPGDIEEAGWQKLLQKSDFCKELQKVDIFMASHHGRDNGYCEEVFRKDGRRLCSPRIIIMSDGPMKHATQNTWNKYAQWVVGSGANGRKILTTRNDGDITIEADSTNGYSITSSHNT